MFYLALILWKKRGYGQLSPCSSPNTRGHPFSQHKVTLCDPTFMLQAIFHTTSTNISAASSTNSSLKPKQQKSHNCFSSTFQSKKKKNVQVYVASEV